MNLRSGLAAFALVASASLSNAAVIPTYTNFGDLTGATFSGTGIPTNPTAITTANGFTLGLTAFGRYQNPPLTNNGAGTFYATRGVNDGLGAPPQALGTTWGFGYYINGGTTSLGAYQIDLFYDLDPAAGTNLADMGRIDIDQALNDNNVGFLTLVQDAQNLYFSFFSDGNAYTTPPPTMDFDPNAAGEYALMLRVSDETGDVLATSSILVQVIPEPGSLALVGLGLMGLAGARRRRI